jgi:hypothetical protein
MHSRSARATVEHPRRGGGGAESHCYQIGSAGCGGQDAIPCVRANGFLFLRSTQLGKPVLRGHQLDDAGISPEGSIRSVTQCDVVHMLGDVTMFSKHPSQRRSQLRIDRETHRLRRAQNRVVGLRCCVREARLDVVGGQVGVVLKDFPLGRSRREKRQHVGDAHTWCRERLDDRERCPDRRQCAQAGTCPKNIVSPARSGNIVV